MIPHSWKPVDEAARERAALDLDHSFCVEAGAGTGKTSLLVDRFLSIVASGRAAAPEIVALTFTEKAAGEMKLRIRREIGRGLAAGGRSGIEQRRLEAARDDLERSTISTIHAFAAAILREHPIEAGIDPGFAQLDGLEGSLFFDECWNDFLLEGASAMQETIRRFVALGGSVRHLADMARVLYERRGERSCEGIFAAREGVSGRPSGKAVPPACDLIPGASLGSAAGEVESGDGSHLKTLREEFRGLVARLSVLARDHCIYAEDRGRLAIEEIARETEALATLEGEDLERFILSLKIPKPKGNKANWSPGEACAEQKSVFEALARMQAEARVRASDVVAAGLARLFDAFLGFAEARKTAAGVLDFDDLLIRFRGLCKRPETLGALRRRYRYILVDEFQDTDPIQAEIMYLLACGSYAGEGACSGMTDGSPSTGAQSVPAPDPGKLFIVGDPKQSIYRFRKADVEIYELFKETLEGAGGERLSIVQNFRSVPGIVDWVNATFSAVMQPPPDGRYQPRYEGIRAARDGGAAAVVAFDLEMEEAAPSSAEIRRREGEAVARTIHHLVSSGASVMNPATKQMDPIAYRHIAVIYPGTTGIDNYEDPLRSENIPYIIEGGKLYYTREEIRALAAAVWAIEDPYDPLALLGALRSPIFGASDEEIFLFTRAGGRLEYLDAGAAALLEFPELAAAFQLLRDLHVSRNVMGPSGIMLELLRHTKLLELSLLRPHGDQRVANIRKAVASARAFGGGAGSFRRFARWFRDQEMLASEEGESPMVEEDENAVRLLTVHKAKGLQFPVVILANLVQTRRTGSRIIVGAGGRIAFKIGDTLETGDYAELALGELARERAETIRLLYVACTRAGDLLIVPRCPKSGGYFDIIGANLETSAGSGSEHGNGRGTAGAVGVAAAWTLSSMPPLRGEARPFTRLGEPTAADRERNDRMRDEWERKRFGLLERAKRTSVVVAPSRLSGETIAEASIDEEMEREAPIPGRKSRAALFGKAFHRIMELVDGGDSSELARITASVTAELGIGPDASELERLAKAVLASDLMRRVSHAARRLYEVPFILPVEGGFMQGRMDLLFEERESWTIVDFKTDDIAGRAIDRRIAAYRPQAALYALALERLGFRSSGEIVLYFVRPLAAESIAVTPKLLEEASVLLGRAINGKSL